MCIYIYIYIYIDIYRYIDIDRFIYLSISISIYIGITLSIDLSIYLSIFRCICINRPRTGRAVNPSPDPSSSTARRTGMPDSTRPKMTCLLSNSVILPRAT